MTAQQQQWIKAAQLATAQVSDSWNSDTLTLDVVYHGGDELVAVGAAIQAGRDLSVTSLIPTGSPALVDTVFTTAYWHNVRIPGPLSVTLLLHAL